MPKTIIQIHFLPLPLIAFLREMSVSEHWFYMVRSCGHIDFIREE